MWHRPAFTARTSLSDQQTQMKPEAMGHHLVSTKHSPLLQWLSTQMQLVQFTHHNTSSVSPLTCDPTVRDPNTVPRALNERNGKL